MSQSRRLLAALMSRAAEFCEAWDQGVLHAANRSQGALVSQVAGAGMNSQSSLENALTAHRATFDAHQVCVLFQAEHYTHQLAEVDDVLLSRATYQLFDSLLQIPVFWRKITGPLTPAEHTALRESGEWLEKQNFPLRHGDTRLQSGLSLALQAGLCREFDTLLDQLRSSGPVCLVRNLILESLHGARPEQKHSRRPCVCSIDAGVMAELIEDRPTPASEVSPDWAEPALVEAGRLFLRDRLKPRDGDPELWFDLLREVILKQNDAKTAAEMLKQIRGEAGTYDKFCRLRRELEEFLCSQIGGGLGNG